MVAEDCATQHVNVEMCRTFETSVVDLAHTQCYVKLCCRVAIRLCLEVSGSLRLCVRLSASPFAACSAKQTNTPMSLQTRMYM